MLEWRPIQPDELWRYLDDSAVRRLQSYFDSGEYTGGRFERFAGGGDRSCRFSFHEGAG